MIKHHKSESESKKEKNKSTKQQIKDTIRESRSDVGVPWDKDWLKGGRVDIPQSEQPMPENPLIFLERRGLEPQHPKQDGQKDKVDSNK